MKKTLVVSILALALLFVFSAAAMCDGKDRDQNQKIRELNDRVASLEQTVSTQQEQIAQLQDAVDMLGKDLKKTEWRMIRRDHKEKREMMQEPTPVPTAMPVMKGKLVVTAARAKLLEVGRDNKASFAYSVDVVNKDNWAVSGFKLKINLKDSNGFTIDTYMTEPLRMDRNSKKTFEGEGTMRADRSGKVTGATAEEIWP